MRRDITMRRAVLNVVTTTFGTSVSSSSANACGKTSAGSVR
jgi:hypothetical protein